MLNRHHPAHTAYCRKDLGIVIYQGSNRSPSIGKTCGINASGIYRIIPYGIIYRLHQSVGLTVGFCSSILWHKHEKICFLGLFPPPRRLKLVFCTFARRTKQQYHWPFLLWCVFHGFRQVG